MTIEMARDTISLKRIDGAHWLIQDTAFPMSDARRVVACLSEDDAEIEAVWVQPVPLPTRFLTPDAALDALMMWRANSRRSTRPVPIPHRRPPADRFARRA